MRVESLKIAGWLKNSFIDFPGTVSTVLFFGGCNLRCPYCHNPEIVTGRVAQDISITDVKQYLINMRAIIDGVVLSGGEPTLYDILPEVISEFRSIGLKIKLDTNGLRPEMILKCDPDYLAVDFKTDPEFYNKLGYTGSSSIQSLQSTLDIVRSMGERAEIRITAAQGFVDESIALSMARYLDGISKVFIQKVNIDTPTLDPAFSEKPQISDDDLRQIRDIICASGVKSCVVRGEEMEEN
jgi:pyruvate formate lyase activating enzyme